MRRSGRSETLADPARLLSAVKACRAECCTALATLTIQGDQYRAVTECMKGLDDLTAALTGDREMFWTKANSALNKS